MVVIRSLSVESGYQHSKGLLNTITTVTVNNEGFGIEASARIELMTPALLEQCSNH